MPEGSTLAIELCGKLADAGERTVSVIIPAAGCTVADLLDRVRATRPALAALLAPGKVRACVNETIVRDGAAIHPGDVVALFPPVSGG